MPPTDASSPNRFTMVCLKCERRIVARTAWVGVEVQCPHCSATMRVPAPRPDGQPVRASPPLLVMRQHRFSFSCPRCESLLESQRLMSGQTGRCPTCGAHFVIPELDSAGDPLAAELIDSDAQDPTPMHAYAASGHQAPRIRRLPDGTMQIECPRCTRRSEVTANNCAGCGLPFTIEGVPTAPLIVGSGFATASLVFGILAIPLCFLVLPGLLATAFGLTTWLRRHGSRVPGQAWAGMILGGISLAMAMFLYLM
jgi:DNA-directed RNA polymerase subunit RPC12/RpoP